MEAVNVDLAASPAGVELSPTVAEPVPAPPADVPSFPDPGPEIVLVDAPPDPRSQAAIAKFRDARVQLDAAAEQLIAEIGSASPASVHTAESSARQLATAAAAGDFAAREKDLGDRDRRIVEREGALAAREGELTAKHVAQDAEIKRRVAKLAEETAQIRRQIARVTDNVHMLVDAPPAPNSPMLVDADFTRLRLAVDKVQTSQAKALVDLNSATVKNEENRRSYDDASKAKRASEALRQAAADDYAQAGRQRADLDAVRHSFWPAPFRAEPLAQVAAPIESAVRAGDPDAAMLLAHLHAFHAADQSGADAKYLRDAIKEVSRFLYRLTPRIDPRAAAAAPAGADHLHAVAMQWADALNGLSNGRYSIRVVTPGEPVDPGWMIRPAVGSSFTRPLTWAVNDARGTATHKAEVA